MEAAATPLTNEEMWEEVERRHAERYPDGCREAGHSCEACHRRLGITAHVVRSYRVGARSGYRGQWRHECTQCSYRAGA